MGEVHDKAVVIILKAITLLLLIEFIYKFLFCG